MCTLTTHSTGYIMNITLSADKKLIQKVRAYARKRNTSLNNLIREYLQKLASDSDLNAIADEFEHNARSFGGRSENGFRFDREEIYDRELKNG